jgi:predicted ATPase/DNA-binding CsgD family transcriptional regulator
MTSKAEAGGGRSEPLQGEALTRREREVLALLAQGLSSPEIAAQLTLGLSTVKSHIQHLYGKLGASGKRQAVARARELGLLQPAGAGVPIVPPQPLASHPRPTHNLPRQVTQFFGREYQIAQLIELVSEHPLVTLTGAGGVGKTRLSLQVAGAVLDDFADGVWLVELAALSNAALVAPQAAAAFGLRDDPGRPIIETLTAFLRDRETLLVLDNCEHLLDACAQLADILLRACPNLRILASSREPLAAYGEAVFPVLPLPFPDALEALPALDFDEYAAVRLFIDRARLALPEFQIAAHNRAAVARICQRLDGIPLAIEMAAARVNLLTAEQLADRLDDTFRLLTVGSRTALPRHQTLRATIDWSYQLLNDHERILLRRMSVFSRGCSLEAAEAVCSGDGLEADEVLDVLSSLVVKSVVVPSRHLGARTRYLLLEPIRQYGQEKLAQAGEAESLRVRHLDYFVELAETAAPKLKGPEQIDWLERLLSDLDNLRAALALGREQRESDENCLRLVLALHWFWRIRIDIVASEARTWLEVALARGIAAERNLSRAQALYALVSLDWTQGTYDAGPEKLDESIALFREAGPAGQSGLAYAICSRSKSAAQIEDSIAIFRRLGDHWGLARALFVLADFLNPYMNWRSREEANQVGPTPLPVSAGPAWDDHTTQLAFFDESLRLFRTLGDRWSATMPLRGLGLVACWRGDRTAGQALFEECLEIYRSFGDKLGAAFCLERLGTNALAQEDLVRGLALYEESLALCRKIEYRVGIAEQHCSLAEVARRRGDFALAASLFAESQALYHRPGFAGEAQNPLDGLGRVACSQGDYAQARSLQLRALAIRRVPGDPISLLQSLQSLAILASAQEQFVRAARLFGAVEAFVQPLSYCFLPIWRAEHKRSVEATRARLAAAEFMTLFAEGQTMTLEQAVAYALAEEAA